MNPKPIAMRRTGVLAIHGVVLEAPTFRFLNHVGFLSALNIFARRNRS